MCDMDCPQPEDEKAIHAYHQMLKAREKDGASQPEPRPIIGDKPKNLRPKTAKQPSLAK